MGLVSHVQIRRRDAVDLDESNQILSRLPNIEYAPEANGNFARNCAPLTVKRSADKSVSYLGAWSSL